MTPRNSKNWKKSMKRLSDGKLEILGKLWGRSTQNHSNGGAWTRGQFVLTRYDYAWGGRVLQTGCQSG